MNIIRVKVLDAKGLLQSVQVLRIKDCRQNGAVDSAFGRHGILAHISCVRYLLSKYYDIQFHK